jgi:hydroxymethylpyrimidine/phosphomethylpyrimidine kinase
MKITMKSNCAVLTIAGSDSGGGAGIQADLKTFSAFGVFGTSVITAITAQNLTGVTAIQAVDADVVRKQLLAVLNGFPVTAIKTGMLFSKEIIGTIADVLSGHKNIPLVIDPVFAATSGSMLIHEDAIEALIETLFPMAALITPNMPEAEMLLDETLETPQQLEKAAKQLYKRFNVPVLMKGGHLKGTAQDFFFDGEKLVVFESELVPGVNNHGSGCTLASAIAAALALGNSLEESVKQAKNYITRVLKDSLQLSPGLRVINHFAS